VNGQGGTESIIASFLRVRASTTLVQGLELAFAGIRMGAEVSKIDRLTAHDDEKKKHDFQSQLRI
jgi:hypothetical protein